MSRKGSVKKEQSIKAVRSAMLVLTHHDAIVQEALMSCLTSAAAPEAG